MESVVGFQIALCDDAGRFDNSFLFRADNEAQELGHAPGQWSRASRARTVDEFCRCGICGVPYLLGDHASSVGEAQHSFEIGSGVMATGNFVFAALAGENGPKPSDAFAKPGPTEEGVAIAVVVVAAKAGTVGRLHANGGINHLHRAGDGSVIGPANAEPHEFEAARLPTITFVPNPPPLVH